MNYKIGDRIKDPAGFEWTITHTWETYTHLCMSLIGTYDFSKMGGHRVPLINYSSV